MFIVLWSLWVRIWCASLLVYQQIIYSVIKHDQLLDVSMPLAIIIFIEEKYVCDWLINEENKINSSSIYELFLSHTLFIQIVNWHFMPFGYSNWIHDRDDDAHSVLTRLIDTVVFDVHALIYYQYDDWFYMRILSKFSFELEHQITFIMS